jgi:hypothetical protein
MKVGRFLWAAWFQDIGAMVTNRFQRTLWVVLFPKPEAAPVGHWIGGLHLRLTFDWVDCDLVVRRVGKKSRS